MKNISENSISFIGQKGIPKEFEGTSGIEYYVERRSIELFRQGKTVRCYVRKWTSKNSNRNYKDIERIVLPTINTKFLDTISYSLLASIHVAFSEIDIVWYQGIGPTVFSFIPKLFGKQIYTTIHSFDWNRKKWGWFARLFLHLSEITAVKLSDKVYVVSEQLNEYYTNKYHIHTFIDKYKIKKLRHLPLGSVGDRYNLRKDRYILYLGRFVPEKRIEWLINASLEMKKVTFVLAGGSSHSDKYVSYLKSLPNNGNVVFTGYLFGHDKTSLLSNCGCFVLPSTLEGYPIAIVEALGHGKNCLVGDFLKPMYPPRNKHISYFQTDSYDAFLHELQILMEN